MEPSVLGDAPLVQTSSMDPDWGRGRRYDNCDGLAIVGATPLHLKPVAEGIFVSQQLEAKDLIATVRPAGIQTIIDFRPDGESFGQISSKIVEDLARQNEMAFHYIPVPHGEIPDGAVNTLLRLLDRDKKPVLLYCRTGRRAVRTFALAEASQRNGPSAAAITQMVKDAGFSAEDLKEEIDERIAARRILNR